jgi:glutamate formiminotransferase / formiminotetrahydrofolate cyclodeaminase
VSRQLVECIPNFSEGRDTGKVEAIVAAIRSGPGVVVLDHTMDADHNRSVVTFVAPPESVVEAALRGVERAVALIDLNQHKGVHPRIGAADVVPFVPLEGVTLADCARIAEQSGEEIWQRLRVPVYLYEAARRRPDRADLAQVRRGQYEGLKDAVELDPERWPDIGEAQLHPTAGATAVGARKFLIAYNINLATPDLDIVRNIARRIRHSSGGFPYVKAMGVPLASRGLAQVSMNLTEFEQIPVDCVFEAVETEAERCGVKIASSEIVGLIPRKAFDMAPEFYQRAANFRPDTVLEERLAALESK